MADKRIDEVTADAEVTGSEKIPVDDGGVAKFATVAQVKDFVLARIAALTAAGSASVSNDSVYILQGGVLKPVSASVLAAAIMNEAFGRAAVVAPNGNEVLAIKDSTERKTITFAALKAWLEDNITVTPDLTLADASNAGTLGDSDLALVVQAAAGKKVTLATLKDYVLGKLAAFVTAATAAQSISSSDVIYLVQGGNMRKATVEQLMAAAGGGDVIAPSTHTAGNIPAWDDTSKKLTTGYGVASSISGSPSATKIPTEAAVATALAGAGDVKKSGTQTNGKLAAWDGTGKLTDGKAVQTTVRDASNASDDAVPTEKAVRQAIADASGVTPPVLPVVGNIPQWGTGNALTAGKDVRESIRDTANASHDAIPTEKAVREAVDGMVAMPSSHTAGAIPTWGSGSELAPGLSVVPSSTGIASVDNASDDKVPTEKAVRDALPVEATTANAGLMSAADKAKLDNMVDTSSVEEVGDTGIGDSDEITILQGGTAWKKSIITRLWTWIMGKLTTYKIDDLAVGDDNADLNATTARHGLCPKLSGSTDQFLRGDGSFAAPTGSNDFTGDSGSGGVHGLVPAPASGDAAANKFLNAAGTWTVPPSAAGVDIPGSTAIDAAAAGDALICYDDSEGAYRKMTLAQVVALAMGTKRYDNIFIPAGAMCPSVTNGAIGGALSFENTKRDTMAFSNSTEQGAEFDVVMPEDWDEGTVRCKLLWTALDAAHIDTGEIVAWKVGAISAPDTNAITSLTVAPTNFVTVTDNVSAASLLHRTNTTDPLTMNGTRGAGNLVHFVVKRNVSAETSNPLDTEALLLGVWIQYGRTAVTEEWS